MKSVYHSQTPEAIGSLYSRDNERDNCGMGAIANINGVPSHEILNYAATSVCNMTHRGGVDADGKTGDGSGLLCGMPHELFLREVKAFGVDLDDATKIGVGVFFFPQDEVAREQIRFWVNEAVNKSGLQVVGWRMAPVNMEELGKLGQQTCPQIEHLITLRPEGMSQDEYDRKLFICRREVEIAYEKDEALKDFYIPSWSSRLISYKALAMPATLRAFYGDLNDPQFKTTVVLYHQRFSTNTFPAWPLGQPFRMLAHNGEINTVRGNRNWFASREEFFESELWGEDVEYLKGLLGDHESDSASLDHVLEMLILSGREPEHAMSMLVPQAYINDIELSDDVRGFFDYHGSFSEPWDGPAGLVYTNGKKLCASLDRNGLRPSRYVLLDDGTLYIGSESGACFFPEDKVKSRGRLGPGQMMSVELGSGEIKFNNEIKEGMAQKAPYRKWVEDNQINLSELVSEQPHQPQCALDARELSQYQVAHSLTAEDLDMVFPPMIKGAQEAVFSMGCDIPLAPLSKQPRLVATYLKQLFAQVTNPPIDPIREWTVMSLQAGLGPELNILSETPEHAKVVALKSAILFEHELDKIKDLSGEGFKTSILDATWEISEGAAGMEAAIDRVAKEAENAVDEGASILIISDRTLSKDRAPIPSPLITGAVHHHLNRCKKRLRASLVIETAEARDTHQIAVLFGYGATAVCPYLGFETVISLVKADEKGKLGEGITPEKACSNYRKALEKGLQKIMSKMGISVLNSYQGAQIFEALGLSSAVIDKCFTGTASRIGGLNFEQLADDVLVRHAAAFLSNEEGKLDLGDPGYYRFRKSGETHAWTTEKIKNFHTFVKSGQKEDYEDYVALKLESDPITVKDLFEFVPGQSIPIEEVEGIESIRKRFTTAAMSMGALSPEAHETLAIAMNEIGGKSDSGEGGEDPKRFTPYPNGESARSAIKQVASGRFGVSAYYLVNADELEIKMAQGAKPGEGGQLPGHKVNGLIARLRNTTPGVQLISPPPHHDIYSIEDLAQLIHDLKEVNPKARVTVKLVAEKGVGTVAAGVAKADADTILISGHDGGTAASPLTSTKHTGLPWELGVAEAQQTLVLNNLRQRVTLRTDGGLKNGADIITAALLGAEEYNFGTIAMIAMGCVYVRKCHLNNCPVGVATTDPKWRAKFKGRPEHVVNFMNGVAHEVREIMAQLGVRNFNDLIGRVEYLKQREVPNHPKANTIDLSTVLYDVTEEAAKMAEKPAAEVVRHRTFDRNDFDHKPALDLQILADIAKAYGTEEENPAALASDRSPVTLDYTVVNTDRNIGTRLSGRIAEIFGNKGLPAGSITLNLQGTAGQSLGTFLVDGVKIDLRGEGNDYVGKGMAGGEIVVRKHELANFAPHENSIVGNTCLFGATGGEAYFNGLCGERFGVRNSGATAVVEGSGDHTCEYMTGGTIAVLGLTGQNFGAGMSGGKAYVYDEDGHFISRVNQEMVIAMKVERTQDQEEIKALIEQHVAKTNSDKAKALLADWEATVGKIVRVVPKGTHQAELAEESHEAAADPIKS